MQVLADPGKIPHSDDEFVREILRMRGREAYALDALDAVYHLQEPGEVDAAVFIGVDVLSQQRDLPDAQSGQVVDLGQYFLVVFAPLPAPDVGDYAIGAEVVAATHDAHEGLHG